MVSILYSALALIPDEKSNALMTLTRKLTHSSHSKFTKACWQPEASVLLPRSLLDLMATSAIASSAVAVTSAAVCCALVTTGCLLTVLTCILLCVLAIAGCFGTSILILCFWFSFAATCAAFSTGTAAAGLMVARVMISIAHQVITGLIASASQKGAPESKADLEMSDNPIFSGSAPSSCAERVKPRHLADTKPVVHAGVQASTQCEVSSGKAITLAPDSPLSDQSSLIHTHLSLPSPKNRPQSDPGRHVSDDLANVCVQSLMANWSGPDAALSEDESIRSNATEPTRKPAKRSGKKGKRSSKGEHTINKDVLDLLDRRFQGSGSL